jgi:hypothetical protein
VVARLREVARVLEGIGHMIEEVDDGAFGCLFSARPYYGSRRMAAWLAALRAGRGD